MKKVFMAGALLGALFLHSCDDDYLKDGGSAGGGVPMEPGTTIDFGAGLSAQPGTRTVYGEEKDNAVKIHWNHSAHTDETLRRQALDSVFIFSPHSEGGADRGVYLVDPDGETSVTYAPVIAADEERTVVASKATQDFYAVYPASAIRQEPDAGDAGDVWVSAVLSAHQKVTADRSKIGSDGMIVAEHDMRLCFMKAQHPGYALTAGEPVRLQFQPWSTVLDITIPGPTAPDEQGNKTCVVTQVLVRTRKADKTGEGVDIAGSFSCNLTTNTFDGTRLPDQGSTLDEPNHIVNIDIVKPDGTLGVELGMGESLNLKGFILPRGDAEAVEVEVYSADNKMWGVFLRNENGRDRLLEPGQIHRVTLPGITLPGKASYSSWMTNLSDGMYIADMSIPGSYMSFSYDLSGEDQLQSCDIADQFNAGIRAFHTQIRFSRGDDDEFMPGVTTLDNFNLPCYLSTTNDGNTDVMPLGQAIHELHQEMQSRGNREFCVLFLKLSANYNTLPRMLECLKKYAAQMQRLGLVDAEQPSDFTLGNFRGKILLQVLIPADPEKLTPSNEYCTWNLKQTTRKEQTLSPGQSIERWLTHQVTYVGGWSESYALYSNGGLSSWKPIEGAPVLLSWETGAHDRTWGLTPVTYGHVGEWTYTPRYTTQEAFNTNCPNHTSNGYDRAIYNGWNLEPTIPTDLTKIGLATMNASVIKANTQLLGTADGMSQDYVYRADLDIDMTKLANGEYPLFGANGTNPLIYWWMHGESSFTSGTTQTAFDLIQSMWGQSNGDTNAAAKVWKGRLDRNLFMTTVLGCNAYDGEFNGIKPECKGAASYVLLSNWAGRVGTRTTVGRGSTFFKLTDINAGIPLGIVLMPYIASPDKQIEPITNSYNILDTNWANQYSPSGFGSDQNEKFKYSGNYNTSKIIEAMIEYNNKFDTGKTGGN